MLYHRGDFHKNAPRIISSAARLKAFGSNLVVPKICSSSILILDLESYSLDEIENYFSCFHLARRDRDYHMTIIVFREKTRLHILIIMFRDKIKTRFLWSSEKNEADSRQEFPGSRILADL